MAQKIEWSGKIPSDAISWLTFADQSSKGYEYNIGFTEITASTDDNSGQIPDEIKLNLKKNPTEQQRNTIVEFKQRGSGLLATYKVTQKGSIKQHRPSEIDYSSLKLSVTPDNADVKWDETAYTFTAVATYDTVVYWYVDESDPKDKAHEVSRTSTTNTVTNEVTWKAETANVNQGGTPGQFTFDKNTTTSYKTITVSASYTKNGHTAKDNGSIRQGLSEEPQYQGKEYVGNKSYLEVKPDGGSLAYNTKSQDFTATIHIQYVRNYVIPSQGPQVQVDENYGKNHGLNVDKDVTNDSNCRWEVVTSKTDDPSHVSVTKGKATFNENVESEKVRNIYVQATYSFEGVTKSDEGHVTQALGLRTYQLTVNPERLFWNANEFGEAHKKEFTVKSTYNNKFSFGYTISTLTNFEYKIKSKNTETLVDTYEIWPKKQNDTKLLVSEILTVAQNENKNKEIVDLNQLGLDMTPPFDYMVLRYDWGEDNGRDFDSVTYISGTGNQEIDNKMVGYGFFDKFYYGAHGNMVSYVGKSKDKYYLSHGGDNTQSGAEGACINMKNVVDACADNVTYFDVYILGIWYGRRINGNVKCNLSLYEGGTMVGPTKEFKFENKDGKSVSYTGHNPITKLVKGESSLMGTMQHDDPTKVVRNFYTSIAKIRYYLKSKTASIENWNEYGGHAFALKSIPESNSLSSAIHTIDESFNIFCYLDGSDNVKMKLLGVNANPSIECFIDHTFVENFGVTLNNFKIENDTVSYKIFIPQNSSNKVRNIDVVLKLKMTLEGMVPFDYTLRKMYYQLF